MVTALRALKTESSSWFGGDKDFQKELDVTISSCGKLKGCAGEIDHLSFRSLSLYSRAKPPSPHPPPAGVIEKHGLDGVAVQEHGGADQYFRCFGMATENKSSPKVRAMALDAIQHMIGACWQCA